MNVIKTEIPDVLILEPKVFGDSRGFFIETFNQRIWDQSIGFKCQWVQDNHSRSPRGVLRGLHYQIRQTQGKLVRVVNGAVFDVAVDLRKSSPTFGQHVAALLSGENKRMMWVPPGFAHGFLVVSDYADFLYKVTDFYAPEFEKTLLWNDSVLGIAWPLDQVGGEPMLSAKDKIGLPLSQAAVFE